MSITQLPNPKLSILEQLRNKFHVSIASQNNKRNNLFYYRDLHIDLSFNHGEQVIIIGGIIIPVQAFASLLTYFNINVDKDNVDFKDVKSSLLVQFGGRLTQSIATRSSVTKDHDVRLAKLNKRVFE